MHNEALSSGIERWRQEGWYWSKLASREWKGYAVTLDGQANKYVVEVGAGIVYGSGSKIQVKNWRPANLQDYWLVDTITGVLRTAGELVNSGEIILSPATAEFGLDERLNNVETYHIMHLPRNYADGSESIKAKWLGKELDAIIKARLKASGQSEYNYQGNYSKLDGPDRRAQLQGCFLLTFEARELTKEQNPLDSVLKTPSPGPRPRLSLNCSGAVFWRKFLCRRSEFIGDAQFSNVLFCDEVRLGGSDCYGEMRFGSACFLGPAFFEDIRFFKRARFGGSVFFSGAIFDKAKFKGGVNCEKATFWTDASLANTECTEVIFRDSQFKGSVNFSGMKCSGGADFQKCEFVGECRFDFSSVEGEREEVFVVRGASNWRYSIFRSESYFNRAEFGSAKFDGVWFYSNVWFDSAKFKDGMSFSAANFEGVASFEGITWPNAISQWHGVFDQANFSGVFSLRKADIQRFAAFDGAVCLRGIQLDRIDERNAKKSFRAEKEVVIQECREKLERNERLAELERGCRVLKKAMEMASNRSGEQLFYRFELEARRAQSGLAILEGLFSDLYASASDYGASMIRPFLALGLMIFAFAGLFWGAAAALDPVTEAHLLAGPWEGQFWSAMDYSWANVFKPLSALSALSDEGVVKEGSMMDLTLQNVWAGYAFAIRGLATLQSLFALVLAFLFGLAVRRRFQIS